MKCWPSTIVEMLSISVPCAAAPEVSAWSEDLGGGVVRQTVMTPHTRAMDGPAPAVDLSHGQRPVVRV